MPPSHNAREGGVKGRRDLLSLSGAVTNRTAASRVFHTGRISLPPGWLPYPPAPPPLPSADLSLHPQEGAREVGRIFSVAAGGDRLSVPSTYTNGRISAPHKNN